MSRISRSQPDPDEREEPKGRQTLPEWRGLPPYVKPHDDDVCGEWLPDGSLCQKTVREHINEFREISLRPGTVFSRPSQRDVAKYELPDDDRLEQRRQMLAQQAEALMRQAKPEEELPF